jgi:hypothetical protein
MPRTIARILSLCFVLAAFAASPLNAQEATKCNKQTFGQVECFATKLCECIYDRGGTITGTPAGFRWNCGILRPPCFYTATSIQEYYGTPPFYPYVTGIEVHTPRRRVSQKPVKPGG